MRQTDHLHTNDAVILALKLRPAQHPDLGVVGLLQLLLVEADLVLVLGPQIGQGVGQLALELLLAPAVDLHQAGLVPTLGLAQLLQTDEDGGG